MLKLRNILLHNTIFILILMIGLSITIFRIVFPKESIYTSDTKELTSTVSSYSIDGNKLSITIGKEKVLGTYCFQTEEEKKQFLKEIQLGDTYYITGKFYLPKEPTTANLFDYRNYLKSQKINYLVSITTIHKTSNNKSIYYHIKNMVRERLHDNPYLYTFILGDKTLLLSDVKEAYQNNGISHLFAISGMHIALLSTILLTILKIIKVRENKRYFITSLFLIYYLLLVGFYPSILRGVLFFILFSINKIYYFYIKSTNLFILALVITLLINPYYIYDIGFLYSFTISLALLLSIDYINDKNYFISLLKTSYISFLISIPISLYYFCQINILSIFYNLFFVPLVSFIIFPLALLTFLFPFLETILNIFTFLLEKVSLFLDRFQFLTFLFYKTSILVYIFYMILLFWILKRINQKKKSYLVIFILILIIHYNIPNIDNSTYIKMIDVGQGDSILLHSKNKSVLIDTGGVTNYSKEKWKIRDKKNSIVKNTTIPLLKSLGIKKIDYLILTHGDYDHMGEAINLVNNFKVEKVIFNCGRFNYLEKELMKVLEDKNIIYFSCMDELNINDLKLQFLQTKDFNDENDNSNVIYTEIENYKFMFMGDASIKTEKEIVNTYNLGKIDVLKVGHHGSRTSSGKEFVGIINPKYALISVGKDNKFKHPNKEALDNLKNSKIYRTDQNGTITVKIKNNKLKIETCSP